MDIEDAKKVIDGLEFETYDWGCNKCVFNGKHDFSCTECAYLAIDKILKRINELERQIKIKDAYCNLTVDLGYDYDGVKDFNAAKTLIDELVSNARKSLANDDKSAIYEVAYKNSWYDANILGEELINNIKKNN
jgi:hypothetical protein